MILAAGLLVLAGLGLFVGGLVTGSTSLYWSCVACCAAAAVLLIATRLRPGSRGGRAAVEESTTRSGARTPPGTSRTDATPTAAETTAAETTDRHSGPAAGASTAVPADGEVAVPPAAGAAPPPATRAAARPPATTRADGGDPAEEDVEVTDLLMVVDMRDQVLVVDEHPRYHLADCPWLRGRATIPLPVAEARSDGFSPCAVCRPDSHLADLARARKAARKK